MVPVGHLGEQDRRLGATVVVGESGTTSRVLGLD